MKSLFIILAIFVAFGECRRGKSSDEKSEWVRVPGKAKGISAKGLELWALTSDQESIRWLGDKWVSASHYITKSVGAASDGYSWFCTGHWDGRGHNPHRYNPVSKTWEFFGHNDAIFCSKINAYNADNAVAIYSVGTTNSGCVYKYTSGVWKRMDTDNPCNTMYASIGEGNEIWRVDLNGIVYRFQNGAWVKAEIPEGLQATHIDVQGPNRVILTDDNRTAWLYDGKDWYRLTGMECVQATVGSKSAFCLDSFDRIWRLDL